MGGKKRFLSQVIKVNEKIRLKAKIGSPIRQASDCMSGQESLKELRHREQYRCQP